MEVDEQALVKLFGRNDYHRLYGSYAYMDYGHPEYFFRQMEAGTTIMLKDVFGDIEGTVVVPTHGADRIKLACFLSVIKARYYINGNKDSKLIEMLSSGSEMSIVEPYILYDYLPTTTISERETHISHELMLKRLKACIEKIGHQKWVMVNEKIYHSKHREDIEGYVLVVEDKGEQFHNCLKFYQWPLLLEVPKFEYLHELVESL